MSKENTENDLQQLISEYDGFLNAIRCFLGFTRTYMVWYEQTEDIEKTINEYITEHQSNGKDLILNSSADYQDVINILNEIILNKFTNDTLNIDRVRDEIIEYYGLASTTIDPEGPWNPIISQKSRVLKLESVDSVATIIIVSIGVYAIFTVLIEEKSI